MRLRVRARRQVVVAFSRGVAQLLDVKPHRAPKIMLPQDIITKVRQDFSEDDAVAILELIDELQKQNPTVFSDRILRCIVYSADGSFDEFACQVKLARLDWRDVIVNAEYDGEVRSRHFELPFTPNVA